MITDASILEIIRTQGQVISAHFQAFLEVIRTHFFEVFSSVISLITLVLAIQTFRKYVSNKVSEKQLDEVIDLLKKLENLTFLIGVIEYDKIFRCHRISAQRDLNVFWANLRNYKLNREVDILFSKEAIPIFSAIYGLSENVLLPPSIAKPLRRFRHFEGLNISCKQGKMPLTSDHRPALETIQKLEQRKLIRYPFLYISSGSDEWIPQLPELYCFIPNSYDLYGTTGFFKALNEISKSIREWLKKSYIEEINIDRENPVYETYISILKRAEVHK